MKITQDEVVDSETVIHIELEDPDLAPYLDRGYRRMVQRVSIPGFRKGKAPRRIVETFVGRESLLNEVLDSMVAEVTDLAVKEQDLDATGLPKIEMVELDPFTLKATVPLRPDVDPGAYRDIRIPHVPSNVTGEDIDGRLEELFQRHGSETLRRGGPGDGRPLPGDVGIADHAAAEVLRPHRRLAFCHSREPPAG